jgi:hypothetical protein
MTLKAGTIEDFGDSLAAAIEDAFAAELLALKGATLPDSSAQERHMLFCAIANGVIAYLAANAGDLQVVLDVPSTGFPTTGYVQLQWGGD